MKQCILTSLFAILLFTSFAKPSKRSAEYTSNNVFFGVWKYDQVFLDDPMNNGVAKKEFLLKLNQDGTYEQTVHITPTNEHFYAGHLVYRLKGTWTLKDNTLYIEEHGTDFPIELTALKEKFVYFGGDEAVGTADVENP